ncbi:hypothetical protein ACFU44_10870 [Nocardia rhizosphaerihabitans]|uniref:hypothetical protein n=1 Tax=Nocardia rhizosphaerihabitans TaxID=1691570 RepID=UPI00366D2815
MAITVATVRGYVLEELLARILQDNGYRLLVAEEQDPEALKGSSRGLLVRGRGTTHQVDVLGELDLPLPFSLPMRLFVEAKYRNKRIGVESVRNAYGTIRDVNEHYGTSTPGSRRIPVKRYQYQYALFSASGFTRPAQEYALAQQISLVDLSNPGFGTLLSTAHRIATQIVNLASEVDVDSLPLNQIRSALRHALGTWPSDLTDEDFPEMASHLDALRGWVDDRPVPTAASVDDPDRKFVSAEFGYRVLAPEIWVEVHEEGPELSQGRTLPEAQLIEIAAELNDFVPEGIVLGFPSAPFVLVMRVDNPGAFAEYFADSGNGDIPAQLDRRLDRRDDEQTSRNWEIVPFEDVGFQFSFTLPAVFDDWMLGGKVPTWIMHGADSLLSSIAFMREGRVVRLLYQPRQG